MGAASRRCAFVSKQASNGTTVVSLEKGVVKLTEEVTWMKKDNAVLSAYVDAHPDVQAVAQVCVVIQ